MAKYINDAADDAAGDALVAVKRTESGSVATNLHDWIQSQQATVRDFGAAGDGTQDDRAAIAAAASAVSTNNGFLFFPPGTYSIASNITLTCGLQFAHGAILKPANGVTITINGHVLAAQAQRIFDIGVGGIVTGNFTAAGGVEIYPEWWGASASGSGADFVAIDAAVTASERTTGGIVVLGKGTYLANNSLTPGSGVAIRGMGMGRTTLKLADGADVNIFAATGISNFTLSDLTLDGNKANQSAGNGIDFSGATNCVFRNVEFKNMFGNGLILQSTSVDNIVEGCRFSGCDSHSVSLSAAHRTVVRGNIMLDSGLAGVNLGNCTYCIVEGNVIHNSVQGTNGYAGVRLTGTGGVYNRVANNDIARFSRGVFNIANAYTSIIGNMIDECDAQGILVQTNADNTQPLHYSTILGNTIRLPGGGGVSGSTAGIQLNGSDRNVVIGNIILDVNGNMEYAILVDTNTWGNAVDNEIHGNWMSGWQTADVSASLPDRNRLGPNMRSSFNTAISSAGTITLPSTGEVFEVTGTTNISTINGGWRGRIVTLVFADVLTVNDGSNLKLNGNFTTSADDTLTLAYVNSNWYEIARSGN